jgi:hypothetical protein
MRLRAALLAVGAAVLGVVAILTSITNVQAGVGFSFGNATPGLYDPATGTFYLRNGNTEGAADITFQFGPSGSAGWLPIAGNWDHIGGDSIGLYDPATGTFYLKNSNTEGAADVTFQFGPSGNAGWLPIAGNWDGFGIGPFGMDGLITDKVGLYDPATGLFHLRNGQSAGPADLTFPFGPGGNAGWKPIAGNWTGGHAGNLDTVGLFNPATATFYLRNTNTAGPANTAFQFGPTGNAWTPLGNDWDDLLPGTIGFHDMSNGLFRLRNSNSAGMADLKFAYGPTSTSWKAVVGNWDGPPAP